MNYFARFKNSEPFTFQLLKDHIMNVAMYAQSFAQSFRLGKTACLLGILHDMGKYQASFQNYILEQEKSETKSGGYMRET